MKLYAYCVVTPGAIESARISGLFGQKVFSVASGPVAAVVSNFDGDAIPVARDNILAHQQVVNAVLAHRTPLPFRFGTLVTHETLNSYLDSKRASLLEKLSLVDGCLEMSVKVIREESARVSLPRPENVESSEGTGTAFLRTKSRELAGHEQLMTEAKEISAWLMRHVESVVRDSRISLRPSQRLVLAADCLVERLQLDSYRLALQHAREERADLHFLTSGPWPPYSFANIDLEFKTHFGVS